MFPNYTVEHIHMYDELLRVIHKEPAPDTAPTQLSRLFGHDAVTSINTMA